MTNGTNDIPPSQRPREPRKVIHASCSVHQVAMGFTNLAVSKRNGEIVLDPHVDGSCLLTLAEDAACALRDALTVGVARMTRYRWVVSPLDFCVHLLPEDGLLSGALTARCGHQLPPGISNYDQPPPGASCEDCRLILLADFALQSAANRLVDARSNP